MNRWKNAIERNKANWVNLLDIDGKQAVNEYFHANIEGDILVDSKGIIQARIKSITELQKILDELIN